MNFKDLNRESEREREVNIKNNGKTKNFAFASLRFLLCDAKKN